MIMITALRRWWCRHHDGHDYLIVPLVRLPLRCRRCGVRKGAW